MRNIEGKVKILRKFGQCDSNLDKMTESLNLRLGLYYIHSPAIRFMLSQYGGSLDLLWDNPAAMDEFDPKDRDSIHINEVGEKHDLICKIERKYRRQIENTRSRKLYQARVRALKIINFLFKEVEDIYIVLQGNILRSSQDDRVPIRYHILKGLKYLTHNLKGPKLHSNLISVKYPYKEDEDDPDRFFRLLFRHRFSDIKLNSLLKKMIYYPAWEEIYFISARNPKIIINVFDDRGMDVTAPIDILKKLQEEFNPWVKEAIGLQ